MSAKRPASIGDLLSLYELRGSESYGEDVTMLEHSLQSAHLAELDGCSDALIASSLLHDVGHLVTNSQGKDGFEIDLDDDNHEAVGARVLAPIFGSSVALPVSLHVIAKRWRCTVEPSYYETLSATSKSTLIAQGGVLDDDSRHRFEKHPGFSNALRLRQLDDDAKVQDAHVPPLDYYVDLLHRVATSK